MIAKTPKPPYYAVIFTNIQAKELQGYADIADRMLQLAEQQPGFLGFESARDELGIAVSYWQDEQSLLAWKDNVEHLAAQRLGKKKWYLEYHTRIAKVERDYSHIESKLS